MSVNTSLFCRLKDLTLVVIASLYDTQLFVAKSIHPMYGQYYFLFEMLLLCVCVCMCARVNYFNFPVPLSSFIYPLAPSPTLPPLMFHYAVNIINETWVSNSCRFWCMTEKSNHLTGNLRKKVNCTIFESIIHGGRKYMCQKQFTKSTKYYDHHCHFYQQ